MSCPLSNYEVFYSILCIFFVLKSSLSNISITILGFLSFWLISVINISSFQSFCHVQLFVTPWTAARWFPCPSPTPRVSPSSCSLHWWCCPVISSSKALFSFCPQSFPASGTFLSHLFTSDDQNTGALASASVLPVNIQGWSPLRLIFSPCHPKDFHKPSPAPQFKGINSLAFCLPYGLALTAICDHWEGHSPDYMQD